MKRFKSLSLKKKRTLAIAGVALLGLTVVGTIAYNQDSMFFANLFRLQDDVAEFSETFDSPDDWQPCQEIPKTAIATNRNAKPRYVRMKINEYWRTKDTQTPTTDHETTDLPLTWDDNGTAKHYAVINTQNDDKWELKSDGWYYYKTTLAQDESTDSLLKSVTFNCEVNTVGEIRYSADGQSGESIPNDYAEANYHLYITFQMSDEEYPEPRHIIDCDNATELYDIIACRTLGPDDDKTFGTNASYDSSVYGVNTYAPTKDDNYPVYYYRSSVWNNTVLFAGKCWQAVRTTSTGGVKLIYNGNPIGEYGDMCNYYSSDIGIRTDYQLSTAEDKESLRKIGYMYGDPVNTVERPYRGYVANNISNNWSTSDPSKYSSLTFAEDVEWDGEKYILTGDLFEMTDRWSDGERVSDGHRYTCYKHGTECEQVDYLDYISGTDLGESTAITFSNGETIEQYLDQISTNDHSSLAKQVVDDWYANNMASYTNKLEDTVFCSDRRTWKGGVTKYASINDVYNLSRRAYYKGYERLGNEYTSDVRATPDLSCSNVRDSFTVSESNGNGALTYPVGLLTADEALLSYDSTESYLNKNNSRSWTMTPGGSSNADNIWVFSFSGGSRGLYPFHYGGKIYGDLLSDPVYARPVVSLKPGTVVKSGNGDTSSPWVIE